MNMAKLRPLLRSLPSRVQSAAAVAYDNAPAVKALVATRTFAVLSFSLITAIIILSAILNTKIVQVIDGSGIKTVYTFRQDPVSILKQCGVQLTPGDEYNFSGLHGNQGVITFYNAFPVRVSADKKTTQILMAKGTVSDALRKANVTLRTEDLINQPLDRQLSSGMSIAVRRVNYKVQSTPKVLDYQVQKQPTTLLRKGTQSVQTEGQNGQATILTKVKYIDGVNTEETKVDERLDFAPVNSVVLVGTAANTPVSKLQPPTGFTLSDRGTPDRYSRVIDAVATAYTARAGSGTASGRRAGVGYVAVNPQVIPYGSRLYIMSDNGSFVYGYAIAADTGEFVSNGSGVDVDLYFATMSECCHFGKKHVKIYVLQ